MKKLSILFIFLALLLSHLMCIVVTYNYFYLSTCRFYTLCSAPSYVAFFYAIPFAIGIIICILLAVIMHKRQNNIE